ncbi:MAG: hypothetical protein GQ582_13050 [Methyloprofundus sp.]|nr:hypothetical protein [Methyloprofundus sp.]
MLNKLGLPIKYAIIGAVGGTLSVFLVDTWGGGSTDTINYTITPLASLIGGAVGGWLKQRKLK